MTSDLVISIDELWLKGKNQKIYLRAAIDHINAVIKSYHSDKFTQRIQAQRIYYSSPTPFSDELIKALTFIPGLAYISPVTVIKREPGNSLENIYQTILEELSYLESTPKKFRANVKRVDKQFPNTSVNLEKEIGHRILTKYPLAKVELENPELRIDVRIFGTNITVSTKSHRGVGGLPWGTSGYAVTMLSGGFDSPVASFLMAKRGVKQVFVFFHAYPFVGREVVTKIKNLTSVLAKYQRQTHLYIVPFGEIQNLISKQCKEEYRTIFFRRFMVEISNLIADRINANGIITGDSLGQVSSQTMENLHLMDQASRRIILRPLVGYNKMEILNCATAIGTHDISIIPHDDACSLFAPKNPIIHPNLDYWKSWDSEFDISAELNAAIDKAETYSINLQGELYKKDFFSFDS